MKRDRPTRDADFAHVMLAVRKSAAPVEAISREAAITMMTRGSASAAFAERAKGTLASGMPAALALALGGRLHRPAADVAGEHERAKRGRRPDRS